MHLTKSSLDHEYHNKYVSGSGSTRLWLPSDVMKNRVGLVVTNIASCHAYSIKSNLWEENKHYSIRYLVWDIRANWGLIQNSQKRMSPVAQRAKENEYRLVGIFQLGIFLEFWGQCLREHHSGREGTQWKYNAIDIYLQSCHFLIQYNSLRNPEPTLK